MTVIVSVKTEKIRNTFDAHCGQTNVLWKDVGVENNLRVV